MHLDVGRHFFPGQADNVEKTYHELVGRGVEFASPPETTPWGACAIFKDLDDNTLVLSSR